MEKYTRVIFLLFVIVLATTQNVVILNRGCKQFAANGDCVACSVRYYMDDQGICQPVNVNCNGYDRQNGACLSCYPGFVLIEDTCLPEFLFPTAQFDPFCNEFQGNNCKKCSFGYFFDENNRCKQKDPNCADFDETTRKCEGCYPGFKLENARCIVAPPDPEIQNCNKVEEGICVKCSSGFFFNSLRICERIPDICKQFNQIFGRCEECYSGYELDQQYQCVIATAQVSDPGCNEFKDGRCLKCSHGYYFNRNNRCNQIPATCSKFNQVIEICELCYPGYALNAIGVCVESQADSGCSNFQDGRCTKCSNGFYFGPDGRTCLQIPSTCADFDRLLQKCNACYPGYKLEGEQCVAVRAGDQDSGCNQFKDGRCVKCSFGFYFGIRPEERSICKQIPVTCLNFDIPNQICRGCYSGYKLDVFGDCVEEDPEDIDPGCSQFDDQGRCVECSFGFYFGNNGRCTSIPPECANFNVPERYCEQCYPGYRLNEVNKCVIAPQQERDPGCKEFDSDGNCRKCSFGFYFDNFGRCRSIPPECANFDIPNRICRACYPGYKIDPINRICIEDDPQIVDPGCNEFNNGVCTKCSFGYYFDSNRNCRIIPPTCQNFDITNQICKNCYPGYKLDEFLRCVEAPEQETSDVGCNKFQNGICVKCSFGYYFDSNRICQEIPAECARFDVTRERCLQCYPGYDVNDQYQCVEVQQEAVDPGCAQFRDQQCIQCSFGFYFNRIRRCTLIPPTCQNFNTEEEICESCYPGYMLNGNNQCIQRPPEVTDPGCSEFQGDVCIKCSVGFFFNDFRECKIIPPTCKNFNINARVCQECYPGYTLDNDRKCVEAPDAEIDPFCKDFEDGVCKECAKGTFFNQNGRCQLIDPLCKTFDPADGACKTCYIGYQISGKTCVVSEATLGDPNCKTFLNNECIQCAFRYFKNDQGVCEEVSPDCSEFTSDGLCTDCYVGFKLENFVCVEDQTINGDSNCAQWKDGLCMRCARGTFFDNAGFCRTVNPLCKTHNEFTGACQTCYIGYKRQGQTCIVDEDFASSVENCAQTNDDGICLRCSKGYVFNQIGQCSKVSDLCATYDEESGYCLSCFTGFRRDRGKCIQQQLGVSDINCAQFNPAGKCKRCSFGFYFNDQRKCVGSNNLCRLFNQENGRCTECYIGYRLTTEGECLVDTTADLCAEYKEKICLRCAKRAYFGSDGKCTLVNPSCQTFDQFDGRCQTCYSGFKLINRRCEKSEISELLCSQFNDDGQCIKCPPRSYLEGNSCVQIPADCARFDYNARICGQCYSGYTLLSGKCEISEVEEENEIENCFAYTPEGLCLQCFERFYLQDNTCKQVDVFCKDYDRLSGACTDCYTSFQLSDGQCLPQI